MNPHGKPDAYSGDSERMGMNRHGKLDTYSGYSENRGMGVQGDIGKGDVLCMKSGMRQAEILMIKI